MLHELRNVRQVPGDYFRRCFADEEFDLFIWYTDTRDLHGFQLCYEKSGAEKALTWLADRGYSHFGVDAGEESPMSNRSPVLTSDGPFAQAKVRAAFESADGMLPGDIRAFVWDKLVGYPSTGRPFDG